MKAIKKIAALVTGATMLGATVMGAMAMDLAEYPKPFVTGCSFDGALVVGKYASSEDVVGVGDIIATLAVSGTSTGSTGGTEVSAVGESIKIETDTNKLNVGDNLTQVKTIPLDDDDLPTILADGTYRNGESTDYDYEQEIKLADTLQFAHWVDSDYEDKAPTLGLNIPKSNFVFNYTLDFTKSPESDVVSGDLDDLEDTSIVMMGKTYDIVEADNATNVKLQLMSGATKDVLEQGQIGSYTIGDKKYDVEVTYIGGTTSEVKFKVNGEVTKALQEDATYKLSDGTQIGVREILEEEAGEVTADQVEFYIGAEKLTIENGQDLEMNDEDVDDISCYIARSQTGAKTLIDKIALTFTADDDYFVTEDSSLTMPGIEAVKFSYEGLTAPNAETIEVAPNGEKIIELKIPIKSGLATIDLLGTNTTGTGFVRIGGDDTDEWLRTIPSTGVAGAVTMNYDMDTDQYFVVSYYDGSAAGESYLVEVSNVDDEDGVDFKDVVNSGNKWEDKKLVSFTIGSATLTIGNFSEVNKNVSLTAGTNTYFDRVVSKEGLLVWLPVMSTVVGSASPFINLSTANPTTYVLWMEEENKDATLRGGNDINFTLQITSSAETEVGGLTAGSKALLSGANYFEEGDTDLFIGYMASDVATKVMYDTDPDQDSAKLEYHGKQAYGNVYVSEVAARFESVSAGGASVCKVTVPSTLLDTEVTNTASQNLIIVGGPCANSVAAKVFEYSSSEPDCYADFEEGKAVIRLKDTGSGKIAMLVAGMTAMDTRRAALVLKNYDQYEALSGDEVEVLGTTFSDISVKKTA